MISICCSENEEAVKTKAPLTVTVDVPVDQINRTISMDPSPAKRHCLFGAAMVIDLEVSGLSAAET